MIKDLSAVANEVVADVRLTLSHAFIRGGVKRAGKFQRFPRDFLLRCVGALCQARDRPAIGVAALEVHQGVRVARVSPKNVLDRVDALEELVPIHAFNAS